MYLVYSVLALAETFVFLASAIGVLFLIMRGIVRIFRTPDPKTASVKAESNHHLKRAGAGQSG
jgi:hypothetical protein